MSGLQIAVLVFLALSAITNVASVGKPRKPLSAGVATIALIFEIAIAILVIMFGGQNA